MTMVLRLTASTLATSSNPPYVETVSEVLVGEVYPIAWNIKREQDNTGSWSASIPYTEEFANLFADPYVELIVYFYLDGVEQMYGLVDDADLDVADDKVIYSISGLGEAGLLDRHISANAAHFFDTEIISILYGLLYTAGWTVGDYSTMISPGKQITIDLRELDTLLPQIRRVCETVPNLHWRYGGLDPEGRRTLDFGLFDEVQPVRLLQSGAPVLTPTLATTEGEIRGITQRGSRANLISEVAGVGGAFSLSGSMDTQNVINLWFVNELFIAFPALEDPDYPLVVAGDNYRRIRNASLYPAGGSSRQIWDFLVTENSEPPTLSDVASAAYSLYLRSIRFLQEHADPQITYSASVVGLKTMPSISDRIYIDANFLTTSIPGCGHIQVPGVSLHGDYRVGSWDLKGAGDKIEASFALTEGEFIGPAADSPGFGEGLLKAWELPLPGGADDVTQYAVRWAEPPENRRLGSIASSFGKFTQKWANKVQAAGAAPDCALSVSGILGKEITIPSPPAPAGDTKVDFIGLVPDPRDNYVLEILQLPVVGGQDLKVCFTWGRDWTVADSVAIRAYYRFH